MLSNAYFLAKFRFDTAENEPAKNLQNIAKFQKFQLENLVDFENDAKRIFSCKNRCRYSRKRAKIAEILPKIGTYPTGPRRRTYAASGAAGAAYRVSVVRAVGALRC